VLGEEFDICTACNEDDVNENLRQIREARRQADWIVVSLHNQDLIGRSWLTAKKRTDVTDQPDFVHDFAHRAIDAGADILAIHGPHILMGIEIYRGRPIFYSLGNLIMQNDMLKHVPSYPFDRFGLDPHSTPSDFFDRRTGNGTKGHPVTAEFWQAIVAICRFDNRNLSHIDIHPVDMGYGRPRQQRGRPLLADAELGRTILDRLAQLSNTFRTVIEQQAGRGIVRA
jgi:poly-gamma-glutamate capsule biosynthesis protein CapA/YwtB (metallophosphatase superfamily)